MASLTLHNSKADIYARYLQKDEKIEFLVTGNLVNSCPTSTMDKIHHRPVIVPFSLQILRSLLQATLDVSQ